MNQLAIPLDLIKVTKQLLNNRLIYLKGTIKGELLAPDLHCQGLPQESPPNPLFFTIYTADLKLLASEHTEICNIIRTMW